MDRARVSQEEAERRELVEFWEANEDLFEDLGQRIGTAALAGDMRSLGLFISYLERILGLGLQLAYQVRKEESASAHA